MKLYGFKELSLEESEKITGGGPENCAVIVVAGFISTVIFIAETVSNFVGGIIEGYNETQQ